jgi:hypothetical protein
MSIISLLVVLSESFRKVIAQVKTKEEPRRHKIEIAVDAPCSKESKDHARKAESVLNLIL